MKQGYKLRALGDVASVVRSTPTLSAAAKKLGVNRSTLHRWMEAGKVKREKPKAGATTDVVVPPESVSADDWAAKIRSEHTLTPTQDQMVSGALLALQVSRDVTQAATTRLAAIRTFQTVVRDLALDADADAAKPQERIERQRRPGIDPRNVLMAVK